LAVRILIELLAREDHKLDFYYYDFDHSGPAGLMIEISNMAEKVGRKKAEQSPV
jgi:hypothetical protein